MLDIALKFVVDELNAYLKARTGVTDDVVTLGQVIDDNGKYAFAKESLVLTLVNLEQETASRQQLPDSQYRDGKSIKLPPQLHLNLYLMFVARFSVYDQALKYLSHTLNFFQANAAFSADRHPALDPAVERLSLDLQSPSYDQLNQIWAYLGGKHLPSVLYKMRVISLQDMSSEIGPPVLTVNSDLHSL
ncbi:DUF4255 domain-containing protein [Motiliproteus coralliicola]|uniref:DUF4255 domain-containing protein n=1 Tax=Motiliproteus coralliicola TaxID=2283196 RepID=A0A369WYU1_9GAMM|nr:DUF4255 domain-containing protein [Motiliproteus coralliicola]RDE24675.1 DUF4255 domain-containing protein [Motiliproteus coralliicola]